MAASRARKYVARSESGRKCPLDRRSHGDESPPPMTQRRRKDARSFVRIAKKVLEIANQPVGRANPGMTAEGSCVTNETQNVRRRLFVTSDKGLAGGLNTNILHCRNQQNS